MPPAGADGAERAEPGRGPPAWLQARWPLADRSRGAAVRAGGQGAEAVALERAPPAEPATLFLQAHEVDGRGTTVVQRSLRQRLVHGIAVELMVLPLTV